jgi:hypothetical protein
MAAMLSRLIPCLVVLVVATLSPTVAGAASPDAQRPFTGGAGFSTHTTTTTTSMFDAIDSGRVPMFTGAAPLGVVGSNLTFQATPASVPPGGHTTVSGVLSFADSASAAGLTVSLSMTRPDTTVASLGDVVTAADGSFSLPVAEALSQTGSYVFTASYAGDATHSGVQAMTTVTSGPVATTLALTTSKAAVVVGQYITVGAHLTGAPAGSAVMFYATTSGGKRLLTTKHTGTGGTITFLQRPLHNTVYSAVFAGDASSQRAVSANVRVNVVPYLAGAMSRPNGVSGSYRLYRYNAHCVAAGGSNCPLFGVTMLPKSPGKNVWMVIQQYTRSGWVSVASWRRGLDRASHTTFPVRYANTSVIGKRFRILAVYTGDRDNAAAGWGYWYFRITR